MSQPEIEMADVQIILKDGWEDRQDEAIAQLRAAGLQVEDVNDDEAEIEGTVPVNKIGDLKRLDCVAYVRTVFKYEDEADAPEADGSDDEEDFQPL